MDLTENIEKHIEDDYNFSSIQEMDVVVSQDKPISYDQVENSTGGYVYKVTDTNRVLRFLCLGTEKGSYYAKETELHRENVQSIDR